MVLLWAFRQEVELECKLCIVWYRWCALHSDSARPYERERRRKDNRAGPCTLSNPEWPLWRLPTWTRDPPTQFRNPRLSGVVRRESPMRTPVPCGLGSAQLVLHRAPLEEKGKQRVNLDRTWFYSGAIYCRQEVVRVQVAFSGVAGVP
jgi:hypothetical protein